MVLSNVRFYRNPKSTRFAGDFPRYRPSIKSECCAECLFIFIIRALLYFIMSSFIINDSNNAAEHAFLNSTKDSENGFKALQGGAKVFSTSLPFTIHFPRSHVAVNPHFNPLQPRHLPRTPPDLKRCKLSLPPQCLDLLGKEAGMTALMHLSDIVRCRVICSVSGDGDTLSRRHPHQQRPRPYRL
jgi:hypothetical protein